jgi:hypothetical protein
MQEIVMGAYIPRLIVGNYEDAEWRASKANIEALRKACLDKKGDVRLAKFAKLLSCELSFSSSDLKTPALRKVFRAEWCTTKGRKVSRPADSIVVTDLSFGDEFVHFSLIISWRDVPIHSSIDDDAFCEALEYSSDLLDQTWLNEDALKLAPDIEEYSVGPRYIGFSSRK